MQKPSKHFYAVILAGGGGTRLWPKSRKAYPKHFLSLTDENTLLRVTYDRIVKIIPTSNIFVITNKNHLEFAYNQLPDIRKENFIAEPLAKNTALAMGVAAAYIHAQDKEGIIVNLAADHSYKDIKKFQKTVLAALNVALKNFSIVTIGIRPVFAHTGLGYIRVDGQTGSTIVEGEKFPVFKCLGFKEKPDLITAQTFLTSGEYLWNANLYCWSTQTILNAFKKHSPLLYQGIEEILSSIGKKDEEKIIEQVYTKAENIQIDYAISEKADNILVIPGDFGWSDIGDWKVIYDTLKKDSAGNVLIDQGEDFICIDTKNCLVETKNKLVVTIGIENLVVVDTPDALLICNKDKAQDVKKAVESLKLQNKDKYL